VTPLIAALAGRHFQIAHLLRRDGARVDVRGAGGVTPLDAAAYYGGIETVLVLLDYKADVNVVDQYGWTPIHSVA
jgi:ankyrin repeat protein